MWGTLGERPVTGARLNLSVELDCATLRQATYDAGSHVPPHVHDRPSLSYGVGGPCIESSANPVRVVRRRLTFLPANFSHALDYAGPAQVLAIEASPALADELALAGLNQPLPLPASFYSRIWSILTLLSETGKSDAVDAGVLELWRDVANYLGAARPAWLQPLIDRLHNDWENPPKTTVLAAELGFSPQFLCRVFKRALGVTPKQYIQAIRLDYARGLLWGSGMTISEVASITGFADQAHLTRTLRQHSGATPRQLRLRSFAPPTALRHSYRAG